MTGKVTLQGQPRVSGVRITAGPSSTLTQIDGSFELSLVPNTYTLTATHNKYLARVTLIRLDPGAPPLALPATVLLGGDGTNDGAVNLTDLVLVGAHYNTTPPGDPRADLNQDGTVDLLDLVLVSTNYGRVGPMGWVTADKIAPTGFLGKRLGRPRVRLEAPPQVAAGDQFTVNVVVSGARGLQGADVTLSYDPDQMRLVSVGPDAATPAETDDLFAATVRSVVRNRWDEGKGTVDYTVTRLAPTGVPVNKGVLMRLTFEARQFVSPAIRLESIRLVDQDAQDMYRLPE